MRLEWRDTGEQVGLDLATWQSGFSNTATGSIVVVDAHDFQLATREGAVLLCSCTHKTLHPMADQQLGCVGEERRAAWLSLFSEDFAIVFISRS